MVASEIRISAALDLAEHICRGDRIDGVPNFLSPDHVFVTKGTRQKKLTSKRLGKFMKDGEFDKDAEKHGYNRNKKMIDLDQTPLNIQEQVIQLFADTKVAPRKNVLFYFINKRLKLLMEAINEF